MQRRYTNKAFSLVEIMIALAVLTFGIYGVLDLFTNSHQLSLHASIRTQAIYLARGRIAELQSIDVQQLRALADKGKGTFSCESTPIKSHEDFSCGWKVSREGLNKNMLRLEVTVLSTRFDIKPVILHTYLFASEE